MSSGRMHIRIAIALVLLFIVPSCFSLECPLQNVIGDSTLDLVEVAWSSEPTQTYIGSPSILRFNESLLLASADRFGAGSSDVSGQVSVYRSYDQGDTWTSGSGSEEITWVQQQYWSNLFKTDQEPGSVYLLGTSEGSTCGGQISISKSDDGGLTWESAQLFLNTNATYATGPTPTLKSSDGRLFRAMERFVSPCSWPSDFEALMITADADADLLDASSWTMTPSVPFNVSWVPEDWKELSAPGYLEGNAVEGPNGEVYNILRLNSQPNLGNFAVVLEYLNASNALKFKSIIQLPGGHSKFVIRRDEETGLYISLTNNNTDVKYTDQRNILTLVVSQDLFHWGIVSTLLYDDTGFDEEASVAYTGFHYVDWQFDGTDLIYLIRTGYRGANSYHNANRLTHKRLCGYQRYLFSNASRVHVQGSGFHSRLFGNGEVAFSNRAYTWDQVPYPLTFANSWNFTQLAGGGGGEGGGGGGFEEEERESVNITATVETSGNVYIASSTSCCVDLLVQLGWQCMPGTLFHYTDKDYTSMYLYTQSMAAGDTFSLPQDDSWQGIILLFPSTISSK